MKIFRCILISISLFVLVFTLSCKKMQEIGGTTKITKAIAKMEPTEGNNAQGKIVFTKVAGGIKVEADMNGMTPGSHGFHIHESGDCSAPDASSAGGHFNPAGHSHGGPEASMRHAGDLGNLEADANGNAKKDFVDKVISFEGTNSIIGKGVIVHAQTDDFTTQPTGGAGARTACGTIKELKE